MSDERLRIENAGLKVIKKRVDGNLNLSRALGDFEYKRALFKSAEEQAITGNPDTFCVDVKGADYILMGCDGIFDRFSNDYISEFIY